MLEGEADDSRLVCRGEHCKTSEVWRAIAESYSPGITEPISDCPRRFPRSLYFIIMQAGIIERLCVELR